MGRAKLPEARIAPRGVGGHLAQLDARARHHARTARAVGIVVAQVLGWTAFAIATVALLVWLAPPPRSAQLDELRRLQDDFARSQAHMEQARRAMEKMQQVQQLRLVEELRRVPPLPAAHAEWRLAPPPPPRPAQ